jgi:hypothetical protein
VPPAIQQRDLSSFVCALCTISGRKNTSALLVRSAIISGKNEAFHGVVRPFCD